MGFGLDLRYCVWFCDSNHTGAGSVRNATVHCYSKVDASSAKTETDDYFLDPDDDSNNHDQDLQIRVPRTPKPRPSLAAIQSSKYLGFQGPNGKNPLKPSTPLPLYETKNSGVDQLAQSLGVMTLQNPSQSASQSRGWSWSRFRSSLRRSTLRRSKMQMDLSYLLKSATKNEPIKSENEPTSPMSSDSGYDAGYSSG
nr:PREDICTED: uncharacterized protein LOC109032396 [Bemisia tabaci]